MNSRDRGPAWWQLNLLVPVMVGLLVLDARAPLSERGHTVAAVGIVLLVYGLVGLWLWANKLALMRANELVALLRESHEKVVREKAGRECFLADPLQTMPLETGTGRNDNGDRDPSQAAEAVLAPGEREEG